MSVFTFWVFVEVCDVLSAIRTDCLGADVAAHHSLLTGDLNIGAIILSLPVDPVTVHLQTHKYSQVILLLSENSDNLRVSLGFYIEPLTKKNPFLSR